MPKLSIVTPSYQQAAYLERTIRSVLDQDYSDFEYFVMDGGSTDGSLEIIQRHAADLGGWVSERDRGQADAINKGFARCRGDIFAWINSDDYYLPDAFSSAVSFLQAHPEVDLVYGDVLSLDGESRLINVMRFADFSLMDLMTFHMIGQPAVFFRRSAWEAAGGLDLSYHYLLDHHLWLRIAARSGIAYVPEPWACARFYPQAKNRAHAADFGKEAFRLVEWMHADLLFRNFFPHNERAVKAGAAWLDANYLSNGGLAWKSLARYAQVLLLSPGRVWTDRRRAVLTLLMTVAPGLAQKLFEQGAQRRLDGLDEYRRYVE